MKKITRNERVLDYIKRFGKITPLEALRDCGTLRLSAAIYDLKKKGYQIKTEMVRVKTRYDYVYVAQYSLEGK